MNQQKLKNTRLVLKKQNILQALLILSLIIVFNILASKIFFRFDLTKEKRFSITEVSQNILSELDDKVYIEVYFDSKDLPVELIRYQKVVKEFLENFSSFSNKIEFVFKNPFDENDPNYNIDVYKILYNKGLNPTFISQTKDGGISEKMVFAGALVKYNEKDYPVNLINNNLSSGNSMIGMSETELERDFIHAIWMLTRKDVQKVAFLEGHKELSEFQTYDIMTSLSKYYQIDRVDMNGMLNALDEYAAVVIAKPEAGFNEKDKFIIDQYIMNGGSVLWLIEWMHVDIDSLSRKVSEMALIRDINLDDQLFNYGVRINPDLIQDLRCLKIPVYVNTVEGQPQFEPRPWYYFPLIVADTLLSHQLVRNLEPMRTTFVSSIDTVGQNPNIKKTVLLRTSEYSKSYMHPIEVNLSIMRNRPDLNTFNKPHMPIAVLLEGKFKSNYFNRFTLELYSNEDFHFIEESKPNTKMIVVSDGDFIRNEVKIIGEKKQPYPLGYDKYYQEQYTPGNTQFLINCINYLCADNNFISLRMREIKIRTLNSTLLKKERGYWTYLNSILPIVIIVIFGLSVNYFRKLKYKKSVVSYNKNKRR